MCTINQEVTKLKELRAKGHVLRRFYKALIINSDDDLVSLWKYQHWDKGWNYAYCRGRKTKKENPYRQNHYVSYQIHSCIKRESVYNQSKFVHASLPSATNICVVAVYAYCDEITAHDGENVTSSRVLLRRLPTFKNYAK